MTIAKRLMCACGWIFALAARPLALQEQQGGFVEMNSLPPAEQMPAAPLLIAAYIFVWLALMAYLWSIWSRIGRVERELQTLQQQRARGPR